MANQYNAKPAIAQALLALRNEKGMSRAEVAASLNTSEVSVFRYENGTRTPSVNTICAFAETYGVTPNDFFPTEEIINNAIKDIHGDSHKSKKKK